jgi:hypothetical protein
LDFGLPMRSFQNRQSTIKKPPSFAGGGARRWVFSAELMPSHTQMPRW